MQYFFENIFSHYTRKTPKNDNMQLLVMLSHKKRELWDTYRNNITILFIKDTIFDNEKLLPVLYANIPDCTSFNFIIPEKPLKISEMFIILDI